MQRCINPKCRATYGVDETHTACPKCGNLLDVAYDWARLPVPKSSRDFGKRWTRRADSVNFSGVWRFRDLLPFAPADRLVTVGEGQTVLFHNAVLAKQIGLSGGNLHLQYEGLNPSGSFKDNGMAAAFTHARMVGARRVACASTGNTSASMALYAAVLGMEAVIFIGSGKIAYGKLAQALDSGGKTLQIRGDFDDAMRLVQEAAKRLGLYVDELGQPVPPRRPEDHHVPRPRGAWVGGAGLDSRAGRQPRQLVRVRQGVHGTQGARPCEARAAARGHQRQRREDAYGPYHREEHHVERRPRRRRGRAAHTTANWTRRASARTQSRRLSR